MSLVVVGCSLLVLPYEAVCRADDPCGCDERLIAGREAAQCTKASAIFDAERNKQDKIDAAAATRDAILNDPDSNSFDRNLANLVYLTAVLNATVDFEDAKDLAKAVCDAEIDYQIWLWEFCEDSGC